MLRGLFNLYSWQYPARILTLHEQSASTYDYIHAYWQTTNFSVVKPNTSRSPKIRFMRFFLYAWMGIQISVALILLFLWYFHDVVGGWQFGLAILLSYPLVLAGAIFFANGIWALARYIVHASSSN